MIKAEVKIIGTIKRGASIRTDKNNQPFLSFIVTIALPDAKTNTTCHSGKDRQQTVWRRGVVCHIMGLCHA